MELPARWCVTPDGFQIPMPYYMTFVGTVPTENLEEEFPKQFPGFSPAYVHAAIRIGRLKTIGMDKGSIRFSHTVHRHEPPIPLVRRIPVLQPKCTGPCVELAGALLAICKPNGIPVHGSGRYHRNTVVSLLKAVDLNDVHPIHRLDCGTSGVLLFGKSGAPASLASSTLGHRKRYVARVSGRFPEEIVVEAPISCADKRRNLYSCEGGPNSKSARTAFRLLHYLPSVNESVVECELHSGRTHQIRVHLSSIGFSIVNDLKYQGVPCPKLFGPLEHTGGPFIDLSSVFCADPQLEKDEICEECEAPEVCCSPELFCLHSWRYEIDVGPGQAISFEAPLPLWATSDG
jgi:hypothetical protein